MKTTRIYIADPNKLFVANTKFHFDRTTGFEVKGYSLDTKKMINDLKKNMVDVVLLNVEFRQAQFLELINNIQMLDPELKIICITPLKLRQYISPALAAGVKGLISYNISPKELEKAIQEVAEGKTYFQDYSYRELILELFEYQKN